MESVSSAIRSSCTSAHGHQIRRAPDPTSPRGSRPRAAYETGVLQHGEEGAEHDDVVKNVVELDELGYTLQLDKLEHVEVDVAV
jgi:hypothetical protein